MIKKFCALALGLAALASPEPAQAGIPECNNLRLEDVTSGGCELRGSAECSASCDRLGIYKKACATKLQTVCREDCTFNADASCTDECTVSCKSECDRGVSITCQHNCFVECNGSCDAKCEGAADAEQCRASCEATCDGECDVRCPSVDGACYTHCIECCGGSCTAQANMDCQTTCQDEEFETCEHELEIDCSGSCDVQGALFCNGQYIISGAELPGCVEALIARGTLDASVAAEGTVTLGGPNGGLRGPGTPSSSVGCSLGHRRAMPAFGAAGTAWLALLGLARRRRR